MNFVTAFKRFFVVALSLLLASTQAWTQPEQESGIAVLSEVSRDGEFIALQFSHDYTIRIPRGTLSQYRVISGFALLVAESVMLYAHERKNKAELFLITLNFRVKSGELRLSGIKIEEPRDAEREMLQNLVEQGMTCANKKCPEPDNVAMNSQEMANVAGSKIKGEKVSRRSSRQQEVRENTGKNPKGRQGGRGDCRPPNGCRPSAPKTPSPRPEPRQPTKPAIPGVPNPGDGCPRFRTPCGFVSGKQTCCAPSEECAMLNPGQFECRPPTQNRCTQAGRTTRCGPDAAGYRWCCADTESCGTFPSEVCKAKPQPPAAPAPQPPGGGGDPMPKPPTNPNPEPPSGQPNPQPPNGPEPQPDPNPKPVDPPSVPKGQCREALMCAWQLQEEWWRCVVREYQNCNRDYPDPDDHEELMQCLAAARTEKCTIDRVRAAACPDLCDAPGPDQTCTDPLVMYCRCVDDSGNLRKEPSSETELSKVGQPCNASGCAQSGTLACSFRNNHTKPDKPKKDNKDEGGMSGGVGGAGDSSVPGISK